MSTLVAVPPTMEPSRRHKKMLRDGSGEVWPDHAEVLFTKAIQEYDRQSAMASSSSPYPPDLPSRNEFIVRFLHDRGLDRTKQQVASHIQQLKKRSSKELGGSAGSLSSPSPSAPSPASSATSSPSFPPASARAAYISDPLASPTSPSYQSAYWSQQPQLHFSPPSHFTAQSQSPVSAVAIRVNDSQPLHVPLQTLSRPSNYTSNGAATVTGVSPSPTGTGLAIRIRLVVPPNQDPLTHLASSRIYAFVTLQPNYTIHNSTLGNRISVNNLFLLEETDNCAVSGNQMMCPVRMSAQTGMMVATQGPGLPITIQQSVYGNSTTLLKITYELVHAPPMHNASSVYQYPAGAGPFTQF